MWHNSFEWMLDSFILGTTYFIRVTWLIHILYAWLISQVSHDSFIYSRHVPFHRVTHSHVSVMTHFNRFRAETSTHAPAHIQCDGVLQCVAVRCGSMQCVAVCLWKNLIAWSWRARLHLQYNATHCNTLQNTILWRARLHLQYTAIHCNTLQHTAIMQYFMAHCNTL